MTPFFFGKATVTNSTITNNLRFPGQYADTEVGLNYNFHRTYDNQLGRYIESDPIGIDGGFNTYSYVTNQPLNGTDALGLCRDNDNGYADCKKSMLQKLGPVGSGFVGATSLLGLFGENYPYAWGGFASSHMFDYGVIVRDRLVNSQSFERGPRTLTYGIEFPNNSFNQSARIQRALRGLGKISLWTTLLGSYMDIWISTYCWSDSNTDW